MPIKKHVPKPEKTAQAAVEMTPDAQPEVIIRIPIGDESAEDLGPLPRFISGMGLTRNELAKQGLRRLHRALAGRVKTSLGAVVESRSQAVHWVLERIAEAETA